MGSNPVFPNIYNTSFSNIINILRIASNAKKLFFFVRCTKKNHFVLFFLKKNHFIENFSFLKQDKKYFFKIKILYYKKLKAIKKFVSLTKKTQNFSISLKALKLLQKKMGASRYVLSTSNGFLAHPFAVMQKKSGSLLGCFCN